MGSGPHSRHAIILFDYDGTLARSKEAVAACFARTLVEHGEQMPSAARLAEVIAQGLPLEAAFMALAASPDPEGIARRVVRYREHYPEFDRQKTVLYDGVRETIAQLRTMGRRMAVLSNKGQAAVEAALERFALTPFIDVVVAAQPGRAVKPDPKVFSDRIAPLFPGYGLPGFLMVGDTEADIAFAQTIGIDVGWASYGYGDGTVCRGMKPTYELGRFAELERVLRAEADRPA